MLHNNYVRNALLSCPDSISHKSLKDDLVSDDIVDRVDEISKKYGYAKIPKYCDERLDELDDPYGRTPKNGDHFLTSLVNIV